MANIITELLVSLDGLNFVKLDLHKDESINKKYKQKDLQDLSKVFAPTSQGFTFPATGKNRAALGFFGDTDVIKINRESKFIAKSYTNGVLNSTGFLTLSGLSYRNGRPADFTGSFATSMTNLRDRIGDDLITDLAGEDVLVDWSIEGVQNMVRSSQTTIIDGVLVKYFVPLASINRVWSRNPTGDEQVLDNIAYDPSVSLTGNNLIRPEELRPCVSYSSIMDFIKKKYNIDIVSPVENREEYLDLRVWCNSERLANSGYRVLPIINAFGVLKWYDSLFEGLIPDPKKYTITSTLEDNSFKVVRLLEPFNGSENYIENAFQFRVLFEGVTTTGGTETPEVSLQYVRKSDDIILKTDTFSITGSSFNCVTQIDDALFGSSDTLEFYIKVKFEQPTSWTSCAFRMFFRYYDELYNPLFLKPRAWYYYESLNNNNSALVYTDKIDLFKSLPKIKVADFLLSHFKAFNISIFNTSPNDSKLYWLTPEDINSVGKVYSKATLDYTRYADKKSYDKEKPNSYNYYNFKHATSKYFSNEKYFNLFGIEYGQTVYPETIPLEADEFKVETNFSIVPPVTINGSNIATFYGFTNDEPEIIETGETRYTPNYDELTLFYTHGSTPCSALGLLGMVQIQTAPFTYITQLGVFALTSYIKVMPWSASGKSFSFSVLLNGGTEYINTIYSRYYAKQTARLLNPNVLSQLFSLTLPANELYLNESTTIQGAGQTPSGFRLQNDIIIGENLFSIVEATIDQTTGKAKMTLLNY